MTPLLGRIRVYIACSLDGFIAGPNNELEWLTDPRPSDKPRASAQWADTASDALGYEEFFADLGAMLMGRGTYDVVQKFDPWPYGELPVLVATSRPLDGAPESVTAVSGPPRQILAAAQEVAGAKDIYLDGGAMIRSFLDEGLVDDIVVTVTPVILGAGRPLFAGTTQRHDMTVVKVSKFDDGMIQLRMVPAGRGEG